MWTEILFIWIEDIYELQVEMAKAGHHVTKHTFAYLKSFSIITIIIINNNSIDYSTNNIHEDRVNKCRKMAIRLLRPNTKPYSITFFLSGSYLIRRSILSRKIAIPKINEMHPHTRARFCAPCE